MVFVPAMLTAQAAVHTSTRTMPLSAKGRLCSRKMKRLFRSEFFRTLAPEFYDVEISTRPFICILAEIEHTCVIQAVYSLSNCDT